MPNRRLAFVLFGSMSAVVAILLLPMLVLAAAHKPYMSFLPGILGTMPGFMVAALAWRGKLPHCART